MYSGVVCTEVEWYVQRWSGMYRGGVDVQRWSGCTEVEWMYRGGVDVQRWSGIYSNGVVCIKVDLKLSFVLLSFKFGDLIWH